MTDLRKLAATQTAYPRFKDDGWPLCPGCGADELWSSAAPATIETIVSCLACGWSPLAVASTATPSQQEADRG